MADLEYVLAAVAAAVVYGAHSWLAAGAWESVPLASGETQAIGLGLAGLALVGTAIAISVERCEGSSQSVVDEVNPLN